ncbi:MAG TPA: hypothetical protein VFW05_19490 [Verrucomicrobiae bacterium]|nr:hypothetical protein [Verrucomicrobiae bacterium]
MSLHRKLKIWAIVSTVIALILLGLLLKTISVPSGGGEFVHSPDGQFVAQASSLANGNPIASGRTYYEFTLRRGN